MRASVLPRIDIAPYDAKLLDAAGQMRMQPASALRGMGLDALRAWAVLRARYGLVTAELIAFLRAEVLDAYQRDEAIEIGAGMGDLGYLLGIRMTDSAVQTTPAMRAYYEALGQPIIAPPPTVERIDAVEAVRKYRPRVVIASWVTQLYQDGDTPKQIGSSIYGVDEEWILRNVEVYVHIGNDAVHADKRICGVSHEVFDGPWLVSRARDQAENRIRIWRKR